jgi:PDZ domain-containing protein
MPTTLAAAHPLAPEKWLRLGHSGVRPWRTESILPFARDDRRTPVALFADTEPKKNPRRRRIIGWSITAAAIIALVIIGATPTSYAIEEPGPVFNTIGSATYNGKEHALITIPDAKTYKTAGSLDMLTVNVEGNPEDKTRWAQVATAWFDPSKAVVPLDELFAPQQTVKQSDAENAAEMAQSQQSATAAALHEQGIPFTTTISVVQVEKGFPADGVLKKGDVIDTINGESFVDVESMRAAIVANGSSTPLEVGFTRDGKRMTAELTPKAVGGSQPTVALGVVLGAKYDFPVTVDIKLQNVGGPSAGMMFALGIIDKMTPGYLNGGKSIAGTGTITASGAVGAIGGIRQKMYGARAAGAKYFLAPASNCGGPDGVNGHIPAGLTVYSTSTLHHSMTILKAISTGKGLSALATCSSK